MGILSKYSRGEARLRTTYSNNPASMWHEFLNRRSDDFRKFFKSSELLKPIGFGECGITSDQPFFKCLYSNFHNVIRFLNSAEIRVKVGWTIKIVLKF